MEQENTVLIEQLQEVLPSLDEELAYYASLDVRFAEMLACVHPSILANKPDMLDRLLSEVQRKTQLLESQRQRERFKARYVKMTGDEDVAVSRTVGGYIRRVGETDAASWTDIPLQTSLPLQQEMGNLSLSITGLQTSHDTLRLLLRMQQVSIQEPLYEHDVSRHLMTSFTGVVIQDDVGTHYEIGQQDNLNSSSRHDMNTGYTEQTSELSITLAPAMPQEARVLRLTIQNVCYVPFVHSLMMEETVRLIEGPWMFELVRS